MAKELVEMYALWENTSKAGETYYSGKIGRNTLMVGFLNTNKRNENEPDLRLYVEKAEKKEDE